MAEVEIGIRSFSANFSILACVVKNYSAARLICTILLYVCVLDTIYGLVTKKIAVGNLKKIIVTP